MPFSLTEIIKAVIAIASDAQARTDLAKLVADAQAKAAFASVFTDVATLLKDVVADVVKPPA